MSGIEGGDAETPVVQVTKGDPSDDELAAVIGVLLAAASQDGPIDADELGDRPRAGGWKSYHRVLRPVVTPGLDAWRNTWR